MSASAIPEMPLDKRLKMPDDLLQLRLNWLVGDGDIANNILYLARQDCGTPKLAVSWDDTLADSQANLVAAQFHTFMAGLLPEDCSLQSVDWVWNETIDNGPLHEGSNSAGPMPWAGTNAAHSTQAGVSLAVRFQTGLGGRGNHGRMFLPSITPGIYDATAPDRVKTGSLPDFATAFAGLLGGINNNDCVAGVGDTVTWVVASFVLHNALRSPAVHHRISAVNLSDTFFDYQRRRAPSHSRHH